MKVLVDNIKIGKNLNKLIDNNKDQIDKLSLMTGIKNKKLSSYLKGDKQISIEDLIILCNYYKVTIDSVLSYEIIYR